MATQIEEIREYLRQNADADAIKAAKKFVPTAQKAHGVRAPKVNELVPLYKSGGLPLVRDLWASGYLEEQILAAKILGKIASKNADETLKLIVEFADGICDWAVCDTLAMQGLRALHKRYQKELFAISRQLIPDKNAWKRRFGIVILEGFCKQPALHNEIQEIITPCLSDKEHYVKKAIEWIQKEIRDHSIK